MSGYVIEKARIGILEQQEVNVVRMPRARFLELVDGLLNGEHPDLRDKLRPVAEAMVSFPLGDWIHADRGCGCVVGEYLVATSELGRAEIARLCGINVGILGLLGGDPQTAELIDFGLAIDDRVKQEVYGMDRLSCPSVAVLIEDDPS